jgi:iduronate 2-sulfatase
VYDLVHYFRNVGGNFTTIPQYFKENGYSSIGMGKIFHPGKASDNDDPISWSEPYFHADDSFWGPFGSQHSHMAVNESMQKLHPLPDQQLAEHAVEVLRQVAPAAKTGGKPFFVAVGFHKPHLPFIYPDEFDQYYPASEIRLPDNEYAPVNMPPIAWSSYGELRDYGDIAKLNASGAINSTLPPDVVKELRRAYYGALSFTDSLIGRVLGELETLGLANNTIISFWGDHGW